jgi:hypothetical protein
MNVKNARMRRLQELWLLHTIGTMIGLRTSDVFIFLELFLPRELVPGHSQSNKACCFLQIESLLLHRASSPAYSSSLCLTGPTVVPLSDGSTL